jgi:hypothetical protein
MTYRPEARRVSVQPGQVLHLTEQDYQYGQGDVTLRVTRVRLGTSRRYDRQWVWLEGTELLPDGADGDTRSVLVKVTALPGTNG